MTKKLDIKSTRTMPDFNNKRFQRSLRKLSANPYGGRRSIIERIFPKTSFWWNSSHNGIIGPGGHTRYSFRTGSLALVITILTAIGFILFLIF